MIFYTAWFWVLLFVLGAIRAFEIIKNERLFYLFIFVLNMAGIFYLSGTQGPLFILLLLGSYLLLEKLRVTPFIAFSLVLVLSFLLKKSMSSPGSPFLSYTVPAMLGLIYRRGGPKEALKKNGAFKDIVFSTLFSNQYVGPVVVAEKLELKSELQFTVIKRALLFVLFGTFLFSLSSFWGPRSLVSPLKLIDLPQHFLGTLNFMFLNFQGAVFIARGTALFLGVEVGPNFDRPYFARSINDFWKRWHTSLGRFFSDHFFLPLQFIGVKKFNFKRPWQLKLLSYFALFLTWIFLGLWHDVSWKFLIWGLLNALLIALPLKKMRLETWPVTIFLVWITQVLFLCPDLFSFWGFIINVISIREVGGPDQLAFFNIAASGAVFYLSQKMFDWKNEILSFIESRSWSYYFIIFILVILSTILVHKGQVVVYGQF